MITDNTVKWKAVKLTEFGNSLPVGHIHWSIEPTVPAGELPLIGYIYNRILYADLWAYAQERGLVITEAEWQALATANDGNVPFYSSGDGSTTFRVPSMKCWVKGAEGIEEVGSYLPAGLPNITGTFFGNEMCDVVNNYSGALYPITGGSSPAAGSGTTNGIGFDASKSNPIYGNSDTVQPKSIVGMRLVKAFGTVSNVGNVDVADVANDYERVSASLDELQRGVGKATRYIIETYTNGTEWYEIYNDGKVRQGGRTTNDGATTLLVEMADTNYLITHLTAGIQHTYVSEAQRTTTTFIVRNHSNNTYPTYAIDWIVEGQGA